MEGPTYIGGKSFSQHRRTFHMSPERPSILGLKNDQNLSVANLEYKEVLIVRLLWAKHSRRNTCAVLWDPV